MSDVQALFCCVNQVDLPSGQDLELLVPLAAEGYFIFLVQTVNCPLLPLHVVCLFPTAEAFTETFSKSADQCADVLPGPDRP